MGNRGGKAFVVVNRGFPRGFIVRQGGGGRVIIIVIIGGDVGSIQICHPHQGGRIIHTKEDVFPLIKITHTFERINDTFAKDGER